MMALLTILMLPILAFLTAFLLTHVDKIRVESEYGMPLVALMTAVACWFCLRKKSTKKHP